MSETIKNSSETGSNEQPTGWEILQELEKADLNAVEDMTCLAEADREAKPAPAAGKTSDKGGEIFGNIIDYGDGNYEYVD